jgi:GMP synthase-like glutamine amidotransferase
LLNSNRSGAASTFVNAHPCWEVKELNTLLVAKLGSTYTWLSEQMGDFENWIIDSLWAFAGKIIIASPGSGQSLPSVSSVDGAILTGSHSMATTREAWREDTMLWLVEALRQKKPLLGFCYGHQLLAQAAGGEQDPQKLLHGVHDTPEARSILHRFGKFIAKASG